jgi:hypothetical protein
MMRLDLASIEPFGPCRTVNHMVSYGTHDHGVSGVFVFKNIMVPTIVAFGGVLVKAKMGDEHV